MEAGLKYGGASGNKAMFESDNEARLRLSRERGLEPMMLTLEDLLNMHVFWRLNPDLQVRFVGLNSLSERERVELDQKRVQTFVKLNELRAEDDREPIEGGDIVLNQVYTIAKQQADAVKQQAQAAAAGGVPGGGQQAPAGGAAAAPEDDDEIPTDDYEDDDAFGMLFRDNNGDAEARKGFRLRVAV